MTDQMDREEFLAYVEMSYEIEEVVRMLQRYGICEEEEMIEALGDYVEQLDDFISPEWGE